MMARKYMHEYFVHVLFIENYEVWSVWNFGIQQGYWSDVSLEQACVSMYNWWGERENMIESGGLIVGYEQVQYVGISYNLDETS